MAIVSSSHVVGHAQVDGRRYVTETHIDSAGGVHVREYLAPVGADHTVIAAAYAAELADRLAEAELDGLLS